MKKIIALLLTLTLLLAGIGSAENDIAWKMEKINGTFEMADLDGDGDAEPLSVSFDLNEYDDGSFILFVDDQSFTIDNCASLIKEVYTMKVGSGDFYYGTLIFLSEYGMSDDLLTYCFFYTDNELYDVGRIPNAAANFNVSPDGVITVDERAWHIGTWYYPSDYILARGFSWDDDFNCETSYAMCKVPRDVYPMGMIVTAKVELPLLASKYDTAPSLYIPEGTKAVLVSSDDVAWLCVSTLDGCTTGYLRMTYFDYGDYLTVGNKVMYADDVFDGIFYAD